jgi:serine/threonine-protein kinase RsbW
VQGKYVTKPKEIMRMAITTPGQPVQKFAFASTLQSIDSLELLLDELKETYAISEEVFRNIWVAVNEAVSNAIIHGNQNDPSKKVVLSIEPTPGDSVRFIVKDEGSGFDPESLPDPTSPERLLEPNGRGVFLIKRLSDSCRFSCRGTVVEMTFLLNK